MYGKQEEDNQIKDECQMLGSNQKVLLRNIGSSVVNPGSLFRIPDPNFFHLGSRVKMIPDPE
jgi:hypothetical protein